MLILSPRGPIAAALAHRLQVPYLHGHTERFSDGQLQVHCDADVKGQRVACLVQSDGNNANELLLEAFLWVRFLRRQNAKQVFLLLPYFAYSRQDAQDGSLADMAFLLQIARPDALICLDPHSETLASYFSELPVYALEATALWTHCLVQRGLRNVTLVAPDIGAHRRVKALAAQLTAQGIACPCIFMDKQRDSKGNITARILEESLKGHSAFIIDDLCSSGATLLAAAQLLQEKGIQHLEACITHMPPQALKNLHKNPLKAVWTTNSIVQTESASSLPNEVKIIDATAVFAAGMQGVFA